MTDLPPCGYGYDDTEYTEDVPKGNPISNITFTIFNYNEKHIEFFKNQNYKYIIMGKELAPKHKTPHIQGFISLESKIRIATLSKQIKKYCNAGCWLALSRGTALENKAYCEKDGNVIFEDGNIKQCGRGNHEKTLLEIQKCIDNNVPMQEIAKENFQIFVQYSKRLNDYKELTQQNNRCCYTDGIYVYGETGIGKTTKIKKFFQKYFPGETNYGEISYDGKYYSSYNNQKVITLDDAKELKYIDLLNLINIKSWDMPIKGSQKKFNSRMVIIIDKDNFDKRFSSNYSYYDDESASEQNKAHKEISRRFKKFNFNEKNERIECFQYIKDRMSYYEEHKSDMTNLDDSDYD